MDDTRERGRRGEEIAERYLVDAGYRVLDRNVHLRHAEIDLIALERGALCFVEVRLRSSDRFGSAEESVDRRKQLRLRRAAGDALANRRWPRFDRVRFDVVAIDASCEPPAVRLIRDAFYADSS